MNVKNIFILIIFMTLFILPQKAYAFKFFQSCKIFSNYKFFSSYKIVQNPEGVYIVDLPYSKIKNKFIPYVSDTLQTNSDIYNSTKAKLVVNAGFFDPKNQKTVSYIVIDGKTVVSPEDNENLMNNTVLKPYLDKILNRSEFRVLEDKSHHLFYDIALHNEKIPEGLTLKHSVQAGPMLLPDLNLEKEFFVLVRDGKIISESASALHHYARTAIGIKNNNVYLFIVTTNAPMTLQELAELTGKWGMDKAMAFDGGGSTSFDSKELHVISEKNNEARKLKSFLILK